jgi:hypothetical protein
MDDLNTGTSTALAHGFGNIQLAGQGEGRVSYGIPVAHSGVRDPTRETYKFKSASDAWASLNSTGDWGGTPDYASFMGAKPGTHESHSEIYVLIYFKDYFSTTGQNYRLGHDALSINTDCFPVPPGSLMNEPLSAFSDHTGSAINSTPLHSSSSPTKCRGKESLWASASAPYPPPDQRKHRSSSLSKPDFTENPTRKRSWSDTRLRPAGNAPTPDTPSCFLDVPKRGSYVQAYSWDPQGESQSPSSLDFVESSNRSTNAVFMTDEHSRSPTFIYHQGRFDVPRHSSKRLNVIYSASPQTPVENTGAEQGSSSLSTHVSPGFKAQVASAAVVKAAQKKRRNQNGKVFGCDMCSAQLTTKQNLQCKWSHDSECL